MKRIITLALAAILVIGSVAFASATEVKMAGDARVWGNFWDQGNYTGWDAKGSKTWDSLTIFERFRLRTDFIASEGLKFRLGIRVNNKAWGSDTFTVDNPMASIDVYQAFLQFKVPGSSDVEFTVGYQDLDLPISAPGLFNTSPVLGSTQGAAAVVSAAISDNFKAIGGFTRLISGDASHANSGWDASATTTQTASDLDAYFVALPITVEGFSVTPWGVIAVAGANAPYAATAIGASPKTTNQNLANNLLSGNAYNAATNPVYNTQMAAAIAATTIDGHKLSGISTAQIAALSAGKAIRHGQNAYWWIGGAFSVTALDPFKFYADIMYGSGMEDDYKANKRAGWFLDIGAEYTGLDSVTPQVAFWYSSGEDKSSNNGSERMPTVRPGWGPSTSFLFDSNQAFGAGYAGLNVVGNWGVAVSLNKMSFVQDLTHRLTVAYAQGTNSPRALRSINWAPYTSVLGTNMAYLNAASFVGGVGGYYQMGRDLTVNEHVIAVNLDNTYNIYENLAAIVEIGWSHLYNAQGSVWNVPRAPFVSVNGVTYGLGRSFTHQLNNGDMWKVAFGLQYKF